jgi:hypothetical protein
MATRIKTPHAGIKIWNYVDRVTANGVSEKGGTDLVKEEIVSTVSCVSIQTSKSKSNPVGAFSFTLAPTRNWTSVIAVGSWCAIMMSNEPISESVFKRADKNFLKMVGRIDSVRSEVTVDEDGARHTRYLVSGQDWGSVFNDVLYVDPLIRDPMDSQDTEGNALYAVLIRMLESGGTPDLTRVATNMRAILSIMGKPTVGITNDHRLAKATHIQRFPRQVVTFCQFADPNDVPSTHTELMKLIRLEHGKLIEEGEYEPVDDGVGWIDPYSLVGNHTMWQVLMDNSNYALNELFNEMMWTDDGYPQLTLFNRIKPFSFGNNVPGADGYLRSPFKYVPTTKIDDALVISVNAGTSWQDKCNFIEIKPDMTEFHVFDNWVKQKSQAYNHDGNQVFDREGFRPMMFSIKQVPLTLGTKKSESGSNLFDANRLQPWVKLLQEWYFDAHRLLNGQLVMTGSTEYIGVGTNIMFDAGLVGLTPNLNEASYKEKQNFFILAHVESVQHTFAVNPDGSREFKTAIQFVRGIVVDQNKRVKSDGALDSLTSSLGYKLSRNSTSVVVEGDHEGILNE